MQVFNNIEVSEGMSAVALGFFDGVHLGHRAVIERAAECKKAGLCPIVFTFSTSPKGVISGEEPGMLQTARQKRDMIESLGAEKLILADFNRIRELSADEFVGEILVKRLNAKQVFCGFNYHFGKGGRGTGDDLIRLCRNFGVQARVIEPVLADGQLVSSTLIRSLIKQGRIKEANRLLGYDFGIKTPVIHGNHIGKGLGFPTINQQAEAGVILPRFGVYASVVTIGGVCTYGVTNVGVKPTIGEYAPLYETWMPEYAGGDLYGKTAHIRLKEFIRPEQKFNSLDELKQTVLRNGKQARELLNKEKDCGGI